MANQSDAEAIERATKMFQGGHLEEAESVCREVMRREESAPALHLLGLIAHRRGRFDEAVSLISRAIELGPGCAPWFNNLGEARRAAGDMTGAVSAYRDAIALQPNYAIAHNNLAISFAAQEQFPSALAAAEKAVALQPSYAKAQNNLGVILRSMGRTSEAITAFRRAVAVDPNYSKAHNNLGQTLLQAKQYDAANDAYRRAALLAGPLDDSAVEAYRRAAQIDPDNAELLGSLAQTLFLLRRFEEALNYARNAVQLSPSARRHVVVAETLRMLNRMDEALAVYQQALLLAPDDVTVLTSYGSALSEVGRLEEALSYHDRAIAADPGNVEAHYNRAWVLLVKGDLAAGFDEWRKYPWRTNTGGPVPSSKQTAWDGRDLHGQRILLHSQFGLGDAIHFARYVPLVAARGGVVVLDCRPELRRLFQTLDGVHQLITRGQTADADFQAELQDLPAIFRTTLDNVPANVPYLKPDERLVRHWQAELSHTQGLRVGLAWSGDPHQQNNTRRSCRFNDLLPLAQLPGVQWVALQKGPAAQEAVIAPREMKMIDAAARLNDMADTAALVQALDLIISVDTSVAHLAGAFAKPVWVLLSAAPDWRWMRDRTDSPWYPTMRLFRQLQPGAWEPVVQCVAEELQQMPRRSSHD